ncbi:MAG: type II secretion system protein GspD [Gammaproteobacteria bacterium]|nr:MAG: type II secretion system protein GspD [Gammaproteobacteria bacterium]RKZ42160.1 MAG: type II secretion system protein GspD [Gammaproteobacteria bacterium]RKZ72596.1 MAG: type II secretion system protein GspD [Gammaproteobacteria bacterium]
MLFNHRILLYIYLCLLLPSFVSASDVTLNFRQTEISDIISVISEVTGKTFVVDPRVKGKVTVVSNEPMDSVRVYEVFLSILSVHGFTAIPSGAVIKVIPENLAKSQNSPVLLPGESVEGDMLVTQVVPIKHVSAAQLIPLLRPLIRQQGHLVAYSNNNTLVISDHANNVRRLLKIIRRIDRADDKDIEVIVLEHAIAEEVVRIISTLEQKKAKGAKSTTSTSTIIADERTNSVLISGDSATRLRLRTLITHLDTPIESVGNTQVIYLRYAQAKDLVNVLKGVSDSMTQTTQKKQSNAKETVKTNIQADESTNSLVITATPAIQQNLQAVIHKLDIRRAQVLVEAVIAEVSTDMARELGVQWLLYGAEDAASPFGLSNFDNTGTRIVDLGSVAYQANQDRNVTLPNIGAGAFLGLGRFGSSILNFAVMLRALTSDTNTNVLSTPSLLTLDNQEAEIVVGQNVPFVTGQYTGTGAIGNVGNPFQTIQREDIGIKLKVKPQINEGNAVKLEIEQEVSSISRSSQATDLVTNKRTIKTTVIVEDGNMVVLGGLIDEDLQQTSQKVPVLGDLPIIGSLFRSQSTKKVKRNLMVFLHPIIIRDAASEKFISHDKYSYMRTQQLELKAQGLPLMSASEIPVLPNLDDFLTILPGDHALSPKELEPELYK